MRTSNLMGLAMLGLTVLSMDVMAACASNHPRGVPVQPRHAPSSPACNSQRHNNQVFRGGPAWGVAFSTGIPANNSRPYIPPPPCSSSLVVGGTVYNIDGGGDTVVDCGDTAPEATTTREQRESARSERQDADRAEREAAKKPECSKATPGSSTPEKVSATGTAMEAVADGIEVADKVGKCGKLGKVVVGGAKVLGPVGAGIGIIGGIGERLHEMDEIDVQARIEAAKIDREMNQCSMEEFLRKPPEEIEKALENLRNIKQRQEEAQAKSQAEFEAKTIVAPIPFVSTASAILKWIGDLFRGDDH